MGMTLDTLDFESAAPCPADARSLYFREADHRAKNSLQLAASLLRLQASESESAEVRLALNTASRRLQGIAAAHAILHSGGSSGVPMHAFLDALCRAAAAQAGAAVDVHVHAEELCLDPSRAIALGLIASEAVSNALKHAFPNGRRGRVAVSLVRDDSEWCLTVQDDGIGAAPQAHENTGAKVISAFAGQLGAMLMSGPKPNAGFAVKVYFTPSAKA